MREPTCDKKHVYKQNRSLWTELGGRREFSFFKERITKEMAQWSLLTQPDLARADCKPSPLFPVVDKETGEPLQIRGNFQWEGRKGKRERSWQSCLTLVQTRITPATNLYKRGQKTKSKLRFWENLWDVSFEDIFSLFNQLGVVTWGHIFFFILFASAFQWRETRKKVFFQV